MWNLQLVVPSQRITERIRSNAVWLVSQLTNLGRSEVLVNLDIEPLYAQVATFIQDLIMEGSVKPGQRAPSTNELATFHEINPATARKGLSLLVDDGVLEKRRGIGMFVTPQAREVILAQRREGFAGDFIAPMIDEALRLGYSAHDLRDLVGRVAASRGMYR